MRPIITTLMVPILALTSVLLLTGCEDDDAKLNLTFNNVEDVEIEAGTTIQAIDADSSGLPELELTLNGEEVPFQQDDMRFSLSNVSQFVDPSNITLSVVSGNADIIDLSIFSITGPEDGVYGIVVEEFTFDTPGTARIRLTADTAFATGTEEFNFTVTETASVESVTNSF